MGLRQAPGTPARIEASSLSSFNCIFHLVKLLDARLDLNSVDDSIASSMLTGLPDKVSISSLGLIFGNL